MQIEVTPQVGILAILLERLQAAGFHGHFELHFGPGGSGPNAVHLRQVLTTAELATSPGIAAVVCRCEADSRTQPEHCGKCPNQAMVR